MRGQRPRSEPVSTAPPSCSAAPIQAVLVAAAVLLGSAAAAEVIEPVSVVTTSEFDGVSASGARDNLINGSGLSGEGPVERQTHDDDSLARTMWNSGSLDGGLGGPVGSPPSVDSQAVVFDLGVPVDVDGAFIWNHNQATVTTRGIDEFDILVSGDSDPLTADFSFVGTFHLDEAWGTDAEPAQFVGFEASDVRLVRFDITSAHHGMADGWVGLSEVRFATGNLLTNGTFDQDVDGWVNGPVWSSLDASDSPDSGSASRSGTCGGGPGGGCLSAFAQCVPAAFGGRVYTLRGKLFLPDPNGADPADWGRGRLQWWSQPSCTGGLEDIIGWEEGPEISETGSWVSYELETVSPVNARSVRVMPSFGWSSGSEGVIYFDDQFFTVPEPGTAPLSLTAIGCVALLACWRSRSR